MAIQITGLRPKISNPSDLEDYTIFDKYKISAQSIPDLFENIDSYIGRIPVAERYNLFFTVAQCGNKKRSFESQEVIAFDLDGIDTSKLEEYISIFCSTLGVKREETGIVNSGNGLHFYIGLEVPIVSKEFFSQNRLHYKSLLAALETAIKAHSLPIGKCDPAIFDHRRILRLPGSINKKPGREDKKCELIQPNITPILFDITVASGLPTVTKDDAIHKDFLRKYPKTDNEAILKGCDFLQFCFTSPEKVSEPQWYAALSITARMQNGAELSHNMSKNHPGYSFEKTETKINHALLASPPRKCKSINDAWGACRGCKNFEKVESPIMLRSAQSIPTESTGFHIVTVTQSGAMKYIPCYKDLRDYFEKLNPYVTQGGECFLFNGQFYKPVENSYLENFAQENFNPYAQTFMTREFRELVLRTNMAEVSFWSKTTKRKVNFNNGVLDIDTMELLPHSKDYGFKYVLPFDYDAKAKAPRFEKYLKDVTLNREDLMRNLLEFSGYALSGDDCWIGKCLLLLGSGANGKSTFMEVLGQVVGSDNFSSVKMTDLWDSQKVAMLDGKLFNMFEEVNTKSFNDSTDFKALITGGIVTAKKVYKPPFNFANKAKFIYACNDLPKTLDFSEGFYRRFLIIPFDAQFTSESEGFDPHIKEKLAKEKSGIFNMILKAYHAVLKRGGFDIGQNSIEELNDYKDTSDPVMVWIKNYLKKSDDENYRLSAGEMFQHFTEFCLTSGYKKQLDLINVIWFMRRILKILNVQAIKFKTDGITKRGLRGYALSRITTENF